MFRFPTIVGVVAGAWLYMIHSERQQLSGFLTESNLYLILFILAFGFRLILWLLLDKASLKTVVRTLGLTALDFVVLTAVCLSTVGFLFLMNTFVIKYL